MLVEQIVYNLKTNETLVKEVDMNNVDVDLPSQELTIEERVTQLEKAYTELIAIVGCR